MKYHSFRKLSEIEYLLKLTKPGNKLSTYSNIEINQLFDIVKSDNISYQSFLNELKEFNNGRDENLKIFTSSGLNELIKSGYYGSEKHIESVKKAGDTNVESGWAFELGNTYGAINGRKNKGKLHMQETLRKWERENPEEAHAARVHEVKGPEISIKNLDTWPNLEKNGVQKI